jgi:hypothetical protein
LPFAERAERGKERQLASYRAQLPLPRKVCGEWERTDDKASLGQLWLPDRSLQGMASLNSPVALTALADMDVELAMDGLAWDLNLELLGDVGFVEWAAAIRADVGQGRLVNLVDLFGAGRLAVGLGAVVLAGFAAWLLWIGFRIAFGEGSAAWRLPARRAASS